MCCHACVLGNKAEARKSVDKVIEIGGDTVTPRVLEDEDLQSVWASGEK